MESHASAKIKLIASMVIFGTIGIFRRHIPCSSAFIAMVRGFIGALFLILFAAFRKQKPNVAAIKRNALALLVSGGFIGINWILLFEAYEYTSIATATLCYYLAPVFVSFLSPILLKERLTGRKLACTAVALLGMVFVSGILNGTTKESTNLKGILFGIGAAAFYACVIILNKKLKDIPANETTFTQLFTAGAVIMPYVIINGGNSFKSPDGLAVLMLITVGILHTGITYSMYFSSIKVLAAQTVAMFSYIDPVVAILLSAIILKEGLSIYGIIGAILILGAAFVSDLPEKAAK